MFRETVAEKFSFLEKIYGFTLKKIDDQCAEYTNGNLDILIGWSKGEVDISLYVRIESDIFKPYLSRLFHLEEIIRQVDSSFLKNAPKFPEYITTETDLHAALNWGEKMMKSCCDPILRGDLKILEALTKKRSGI